MARAMQMELEGTGVRAGIATLATWLIIAFFFRYSSLAALIAALFAPFFAALVVGVDDAYVVCMLAISALLVWRHRANIRNLMAGTESRIGEKKKTVSAGAGD